jgi:hypothetical protein
VRRRAAKVDANQAVVVGGLRACGALVLSLAPMGKGVPDLLIWHHTKGFQLFEVKDGSKPPSKRKLTPDQIEFQAEGWPVTVVESVEGAMAALIA